MAKKKLCKTCVHLLEHQEAGPKAADGTMIASGLICSKMNWYLVGDEAMAVECHYYVDKDKEPAGKEVIDVIGIMERIEEVEGNVNLALDQSNKNHHAIENIKESGNGKVFNIENATIH